MTEKRSGLIIPMGKSARGVRFASLVDDALTFSKGNHRDQKNFKQRIEVAKVHLGDRVADSITPKEIGTGLPR